MSDSYLTQAEIEKIQSLPRDTPYLIRGVTTSYFSVARHFGAATFNGASYTYMPETDELVRADVLKVVAKLRRDAKKKAKVDETAPGLFTDVASPTSRRPGRRSARRRTTRGG